MKRINDASKVRFIFCANVSVPSDYFQRQFVRRHFTDFCTCLRQMKNGATPNSAALPRLRLGNSGRNFRSFFKIFKNARYLNNFYESDRDVVDRDMIQQKSERFKSTIDSTFSTSMLLLRRTPEIGSTCYT